MPGNKSINSTTNTHRNNPASITADRGYLYNSSKTIMYLQWASDKSGNITGQFEEVDISPNSFTVHVITATIEGTISGSNVSIELSTDLVDSGNNMLTGNLSGQNLTLNFPNSDGMLQPLTFKSASVNQYNTDVQNFRTSVSEQQEHVEQQQAASQLLKTLVKLQTNVQQYHDASSNPKHYYPTFFAYGNTSGKISNLNQPTSSYAAEIDLNAVDDKQHTFGQDGFWDTGNASWATIIPNDGEYFGVTSGGIVFATSTQPDTQPDDATQGLNNGNSGNGGWANNNIQVYALSYEDSLKIVSLSSLELQNMTVTSGSNSPSSKAKNNSLSSTQSASSSFPNVTNASPTLQSQINLILSKGYVPASSPNAAVSDGHGNTLYAWNGVMPGDGSVQWVFFFDGSKYIGTDTAKPDTYINSIEPAGTGEIKVTYAVYTANDSIADPTGTPFSVTYQWNGTRLVALEPMQTQWKN
ncbi:LppP/LprE family lipoprotein [Sulfoacidibacillus ferrooxidans]|nr:LppP/LprE family lipoprotein [Sulfoacidibacillus ferrooxidans]